MAGAQVLFKPLSPAAAVGYVPKGPIFGIDNPALREVLFTELSRLAHANRIWLLMVQPPNNASAWLGELPQFDFRPSAIKMGLPATLLIDLSLDLDAILSKMKARTRYNIRLSSRKGIRAREGTARDVSTYCELLQATGRRQGFNTYPKEYFEKMWEVFEPRGHIQLFLAEYGEDIVAAQLALAFGDTVVNKLSVWSGRQASRKPNEALQWYSICWGKEHGYRYYDLEGIELQARNAGQNDEAAAASPLQSVSSFKLGFGGQIVELPGVYEHFSNPAMRLFYDTALEKIDALPTDPTFELGV